MKPSNENSTPPGDGQPPPSEDDLWSGDVLPIDRALGALDGLDSIRRQFERLVDDFASEQDMLWQALSEHKRTA